MENTNKKTKGFYVVGIVAFLCIAVFAAVLITALVQRDRATNFPIPFHAQPEKTAPFDNPEPVITIDWDYWKNINPDIVAWIYIPQTHVNYPIVQAPVDDPYYYLDHDVYGNWSAYGAIYADCQSGMGSRSVVLFGHNIALDTAPMFGELVQYRDPGYFNGHPTIYLLTPHRCRELQVSATASTSGYAPTKRTGFRSKKELASWYQEQHDNALVKKETKVTQVQQVFTLVTCSYSSYNERTLIYAIDTTENPASVGTKEK